MSITASSVPAVRVRVGRATPHLPSGFTLGDKPGRHDAALRS